MSSISSEISCISLLSLLVEMLCFRVCNVIEWGFAEGDLRNREDAVVKFGSANELNERMLA